MCTSVDDKRESCANFSGITSTSQTGVFLWMIPASNLTLKNQDVRHLRLIYTWNIDNQKQSVNLQSCEHVAYWWTAI